MILRGSANASSARARPDTNLSSPHGSLCATTRKEGGDAMDPMIIVWLSGLIAVAFAGYLAYDVLKRDTGTPEM